MKKGFKRDFFKNLVLIVIPILLLVFIFNSYLFSRLIEDKKEFLLEKTYSMASMISSVASFDSSHPIDKTSANKATIYQVQKAFKSIFQQELKLEYLVGVAKRDHIHYIAYSSDKPPKVKLSDLGASTPMRAALEKKIGVGLSLDYMGRETLAAYAPIQGTEWGLVVEQPYSIHIKPIYETIITGTISVVVLILILYFILKSYDAKQRNLIQQSENRFQQLVESSDDLIWEVTPEGVYSYVSPRSKEIFGYEPSEIIGKEVFAFMNEEEAKRVKNEFLRNIEQKEKVVNFENIYIHKDGSEVCLLTNAAGFYDEKGNLLGYRGVDRDITLLKEKLKEIEYLAFYDTLTGLANRQHIYKKIKEEISYAKRNKLESALLFIDLDDFKVINDTQGHDHGDEVLKSVASRLLSSIRDFDEAGRIGGDEFIVLVRGGDEDNFDHFDVIIERILKEINEPIFVKDKKYEVRASIGVAIIPRDAQNIEDALKCGDRAMYEAKNLGKNRVVFHKN